MLFRIVNNDVIYILGLTLRPGDVLFSFYDDFSIKLGLWEENCRKKIPRNRGGNT